jgi:hypothetical protein
MPRPCCPVPASPLTMRDRPDALSVSTATPSQFADGGFYVKSKLETVARVILNDQYAKDEERKKAEAEAPPAAQKEDDVKYLVRLGFSDRRQSQVCRSLH